MSHSLAVSGGGFSISERFQRLLRRLPAALLGSAPGAAPVGSSGRDPNPPCFTLLATGLVRSVFWSMLLAGAAAAQGTPDPQQALEGGRLAAALQQGGFVIYFRHTDTGPAYMEQGVDLARCETQRNLNENGRQEAKLIGAAFRRLAIPLDRVRASEFCRCKETAQLAFGRFEIEPMLTGVSRAPEAAPRRERGVLALRKMLATPPARGKNNVLVSHGFNLWDAEGFHLGTQGEAAIYKPDGTGGYALVARVLPREWATLPAD